MNRLALKEGFEVFLGIHRVLEQNPVEVIDLSPSDLRAILRLAPGDWQKVGSTDPRLNGESTINDRHAAMEELFGVTLQVDPKARSLIS